MLAIMDFIFELFIFLRQRKKLWLIPIIAVLVLFGGLLIAQKAPLLLHLYILSSSFGRHGLW